MFENCTVKLLAKETKWTSSEVRTRPTFLETLISKSDSGPGKLPGLSRNGPQGLFQGKGLGNDDVLRGEKQFKPHPQSMTLVQNFQQAPPSLQGKKQKTFQLGLDHFSSLIKIWTTSCLHSVLFATDYCSCVHEGLPGDLGNNGTLN